MKIYRVLHESMLGHTIKEEFYTSKNKAKKALRRMFKELKPNMELAEPVHLSEPILHKKQEHFKGKSKTSFQIMFEIWYKCSYEYDEWDTEVESLQIDLIEVN